MFHTEKDSGDTIRNSKGDQPTVFVVLQRILQTLPDQTNKIFIGRETGQAFASAQVSRHGGNAQIHGPLPVGINCRGTTPLLQHRPCPIR